ncbi:MAG: APC family permease [Rothia sp. (in: high G+C Gram-positive bacteria)]|nr:APC family permease [Rothia sp. (in: high G+C Gram-positive bacteria)]
MTQHFHDKGLAAGRLGLASSTVIGVASTAPMYSLAASLGFIVVAVGFQAPIALILAFIPMLLTALSYKELNAAVPDSGTVFTWSTKAFGPKTGWISGWGVIISGVFAMANQTQIAAIYLWLLLGRDDLAHNKHVIVLTGVLVIALTTWISYRHIEAGSLTQWVLVGIQYLAAALLIMGVLRALGSGAASGFEFSWSWFNPFEASFHGMVQAILIAIFIYWGWDTCLSISEETKDPHHTPGRAAVLSSSILVVTYVLVTIFALMYAGAGSEGIGLANPENADDVFTPFKDVALGSFGWIIILAVAVSALATCQTTILPSSRGIFAMAIYRSIPAKFGDVHPRFKTPRTATVYMGVCSALFYAGMTYISENMLADTIEASSVAVAVYYVATSFACIVYYRGDIFTSVRNFVFRLLVPLIGGLMMLAILVISLVSMADPEYGYTVMLGTSGVFVTAVASFALGFALMVALMARKEFRPFFNGTALNMGTRVKVPESEDLLELVDSR